MRYLLFSISLTLTVGAFAQYTGIRLYDTALSVEDHTISPNGDILLTGSIGDSAYVMRCDHFGSPLSMSVFNGNIISNISPNFDVELNMYGRKIMFHPSGEIILVAAVDDPSGPFSTDVAILKLDPNLYILDLGVWEASSSWGEQVNTVFWDASFMRPIVGGWRHTIVSKIPVFSEQHLSNSAFAEGRLVDGHRNGSQSAILVSYFAGASAGPYAIHRFDQTDSLIASQCIDVGTTQGGQLVVQDDSTVVAAIGQVLMKMDAALNVLWSVEIDPVAYCEVLQVKPNGKILGIFRLGPYERVLVQFSDTGVVEWVRKFSASATSVFKELTVLNGNEGLLLSGNSITDGGFILRTDTAGLTDSCNVLAPTITTSPVSPNLASTCQYGGAPEWSLDGTIVVGENSAGYTSVPVDCGLFKSPNLATGQVYLDANLNKVFDVNEYVLPYFLTQIQPDGYNLFTGTNGRFAFTNADGSYGVNMQNLSPYWLLSTDSSSYSFTFTPTDSLFENLDFGLYPTMDTTILDANFIIQNVPCGAPAQRQVLLNNNGTTVDSGQVILVLDTAFTSVSSTMADSVVGNAIYFDFDTLYPQQTMQLLYNATEHIWTAQGDPMLNELSVLVYDSTGALQTYSVEVMHDTVNCGCDPNDKLVNPSGEGPVNAIDHDTQELDYTIRFQNTGTDTAYTVIVKDQFPSELIASSFQFNGSSHNVTGLSLTPGGFLQVEFTNILLPDSNVNLQGSKGWISFTIDLEQGLPHLLEVKNNAAIYFDLNDPVITNTALLTIRNCDQAGLPDTLYFYQQGSALSTPYDPFAFPYNYQWFFNGVALVNDTNFVVSLTSTGDYHATITDITGCVQHTDTFFFSVTGISGQEESAMAVYPNPFSDQTLLIVDEVFSSTDLIEVYDLHGRLVKKVHGNGSRKLVLTNEGMNTGMYLVRLTRSGVQEGTLRIVVE